MNKKRMDILQEIKKAVCTCKGHKYDFNNVVEKHCAEAGVTMFIMPCLRCRCKTVVAIKDSDLRVTYPLELSFERSEIDV